MANYLDILKLALAPGRRPAAAPPKTSPPATLPASVAAKLAIANAGPAATPAAPPSAASPTQKPPSGPTSTAPTGTPPIASPTSRNATPNATQPTAATAAAATSQPPKSKATPNTVQPTAVAPLTTAMRQLGLANAGPASTTHTSQPTHAASSSPKVAYHPASYNTITRALANSEVAKLTTTHGTVNNITVHDAAPSRDKTTALKLALSRGAGKKLEAGPALKKLNNNTSASTKSTSADPKSPVGAAPSGAVVPAGASASAASRALQGRGSKHRPAPEAVRAHGAHQQPDPYAREKAAGLRALESARKYDGIWYPPDDNVHEPFAKKVGIDHPTSKTAWCAIFLSAMFKEAGVAFGPGGNGNALTETIWNNFMIDRHIWPGGSSNEKIALPPPGAAIVLKDSKGRGFGHIGIVVSSEFVAGQPIVTYISGNTWETSEAQQGVFTTTRQSNLWRLQGWGYIKPSHK